MLIGPGRRDGSTVVDRASLLTYNARRVGGVLEASRRDANIVGEPTKLKLGHG